MRKVWGILSGASILLGIMVMLAGMVYDWTFIPSHTGTKVAWSIGFLLFICGGGMIFAHLYERDIERHNDADASRSLASAGPGAQAHVDASVAELAAKEREFQAELAKKQATTHEEKEAEE